MMPLLQEKERVLVLKFFQTRVGDVIVCKDPRDGRVLIKRVTNLDGKKIFVEGDNQQKSTDSRTFGWIDTKAIIGKVIFPKV